MIDKAQKSLFILNTKRNANIGWITYFLVLSFATPRFKRMYILVPYHHLTCAVPHPASYQKENTNLFVLLQHPNPVPFNNCQT